MANEVYRTRIVVDLSDETSEPMARVEQRVDRMRRLMDRVSRNPMKVRAAGTAQLVRDVERTMARVERIVSRGVTLPIKLATGAFNALAKLGHAAFGLQAMGDAAVGLGRALLVPIRGASGIAESIAKLDTLLGSSAATVRTFANTSAVAFGVSRAAALESAGGFANLFRTIKLGQPQAAEMSTRLVGLAADLASFNNLPIDDALRSLQSGLVGETEPMRRFGVLLSEAQVQQEAWRSGIAKTGATLTEAQKVQARYNLILRQTKNAQGDVARTRFGFANAVKIIQAVGTDIRDQLGEWLLPGATVLGNRVAEWLPVFRRELGRISSDPAFQSADLPMKVRILWGEATRSFDAWWKAGGQGQATKWADTIGDAMGGSLNGFIRAVLGIGGAAGAGGDPWAEAGATAGAAFFDGFKRGLNPRQVAGAAWDAWRTNILPRGAGGEATPESAAVTGVATLAGLGALGKLLKGPASVIGGAARGVGWLGRLAGIGGRGAAAASGTAAAGAAARGVAVRAGAGAGLKGSLGPIGWAMLAMDLAQLLSTPEAQKGMAAAANLTGHGHDVCECIRRAVQSLIPFLSPQGRPRAAAGPRGQAIVPGIPTPQPVPQPVPPVPVPVPEPGEPRKVSSAAERAIAWASAQIGRVDWIGLCQRFVENMFGTSGRFPTAWAAAQKFMTDRVTKLSEVGRGLGVFFNPAADNGMAGHVGLALGGGAFVHSDTKGARITKPGDPDYGYWMSRFAGSGAIDFGTAPAASAANAGTGAGGWGASVSIGDINVTVQLAVESLNEAQIRPFAQRVAPEVAAEIVRELEPRLANMPSGG